MMKYVTGIAAALACLGLGGLLSGFAPGPDPIVRPWRGEISGKAYSRVPLSRPEDDFAYQSLRGFRNVFLKKTMEIDSHPGLPSLSSSLLAFEAGDVSILTALGPRRLGLQTEISGPGAALPFGQFSRPLDLAGMPAALDVSGRLLLWADPGSVTNKGPVCGVRPGWAERLEASRRPVRLRVTRYQEMVEQYADKYGLDVPLVLAIIQTESGFNPTLVSSRDAHGLMQIVPATAGGEVHRWMGRNGLPSSAELLTPDINIRYGMAYLHLLQSRHLDGIRDPQSLEYCVIASYNGGSGAVLRLFGSSKEEAVAAVNRLSHQEVLAMLTQKFPARETRAFVRKVLDFRRQYVMLAAQGTPGVAGPEPAPALLTPAAHPALPRSSSENAKLRPSV